MPEPRPEFTVSTLTSALKRTIEGGFAKVIVEGEVSGWRRYPSGHCYFTLKDDGAQISAVMVSLYEGVACTMSMAILVHGMESSLSK